MAQFMELLWDGCMDAVVTAQRWFMVSIKSETVDGLTKT